MATIRKRYRVVSFKTKTNPRRGKKTAARKKTAAKALSKKVGSWRCECTGRTVTCAGAKHSYRDHATACGVYKRITSVAAVKRFVDRYGKKATKAAVVGKKTNPKRKKATATKRRKKVAKRRKKAAKATRGRKKGAKATRGRKKGARRNPPISRADAATVRRILRKHGYR